MQDCNIAAQIAATLFNEGRSTDEVIRTLSEAEAFNHYQFFQLDARLYMKPKGFRQPGVLVCQIPK